MSNQFTNDKKAHLQPFLDARENVFKNWKLANCPDRAASAVKPSIRCPLASLGQPGRPVASAGPSLPSLNAV